MPNTKRKKRDLHVMFPIAGLNRSGPYRQQAPYSTVDALNVRGTATFEGRERGGSRPGLAYSFIDDLGGSVRMLFPMNLALGDGFTSWSDTFSGLSLAAAWAQASWASDVPSILSTQLAAVDTSTSEGEVVLDALTIDTSQNYSVEMFISPWSGEFHGDYRLYLRLDDTTPAYATDGVFIELVMTGSEGAYTATLKSYTSSAETVTDSDSGTLGSAAPGWLTATVVGNVVTVWWSGTQILTGTVDAHSGSRVGFGMECTEDDGLCLTNTFRVQYYSTGEVPALRSVLIASAVGNLFVEGPTGRITVVTSDLTVRDDVKLRAAQIGQDLYVADYGDLRDTGTDGTMSGAVLDDAGGQDWTTLGIDTDSDVCVLSNSTPSSVNGTYAITPPVHASNGITLSPDPGDGICSYRIERGPKIYDTSAGTISLFIADSGKGQVPTGCPLISRWLDRCVVSGAEIAPHAFYMSRATDEFDWDYSQTDSQKAVAGTASDGGIPGDPIVAHIPHSDDYFIFGCLNSLWRMAGDPAFGGSLDAISRAVGVAGPDAWCIGPSGELIFLSQSGLYAIHPGAGEKSYPIPLSERSLPAELKAIDTNVLNVQLEYDVEDRGVHIFLTPDSSNTRVHWWFDFDAKAFWPETYASDHEPTATCTLNATAIEESGVVLGCRDGKIRRFSRLAGNDTGTAFSSYVIIGPIPLAPDSLVGRLLAMNAVLAADSSNVDWALQPALTFEGCASASSSDTGSWSGGLNATDRPTARGQAVSLKLTGAEDDRWAMEQVVMKSSLAGKRRIS